MKQINDLCNKIIELDSKRCSLSESKKRDDIEEEFDFECDKHATKLAKALKESLVVAKEAVDFIDCTREDCGWKCRCGSDKKKDQLRNKLREIEDIFK